MLEGILVVRDVVVIVVRISEEGISGSEDIACGDVWRRELRILRILYHIDFLLVVSEVLAELVAKIGVRIAVADNLYRL